MNKRRWIVLVLGGAALCLWLGKRPGGTWGRESTDGGPKAGNSQFSTSGHIDVAGPIRTKVSNRPDGVAHQTHGPERLREFMLPAVKIVGLSLEDALRKLMDAYELACAKSGETPLPLTFSIDPQARSRKLTIHLPAGDFSSSVRLLATLAGMKVSREGREYRFELRTNDSTPVSRELRVPSDFNARFNQMAGGIPPPDRAPFAEPSPVVLKTVEECLDAVGIELDPTTRLKLESSGVLRLQTSNASDAAAILEIAKVLSMQKPTQLKFNLMVLELAAGADWSPPDFSQMTDPEVRKVMSDLAQIGGTSLMTLPSVTERMGQEGKIEMVEEFIYPKDDSGETMESRDVGKVLRVKGSQLGFGHEVAISYTDTTVDSSTGKPIFDVRTDMSDEGFTNDNGSRFVVQTRPDGSKTVVLLKSTIIDATGRPIR